MVPAVAAWTVQLAVRGIVALIKHRKNKRKRKAEIAAIRKEVPEMKGISSALGWALQLKFLSGVRGKIAGIGGIALGVAGVIQNMTGDAAPVLSLGESLASITGGLGILGIRGKMDPPKEGK
jgi:hypothetical protein